ncbi:MAG: deoxyribose-phosphate aldolase [Anaerolineae bacterium]|jgi:deoxyribose-phosphate aldolase|nr:deoxyribose-phosphate aldolase [Anaerolineae bacterium]
MLQDESLIIKTVRQVQAILGEARIEPRTGRTLPDLGQVPAAQPVAALIDHTLLKPDATARQIEKICFEAREYGFASVCVNSVYVPLAAELLKGSPVKVCTVVGFPLGAALPQVKVYEADEAIQRGAREIDMVLHVGAVKHRDLAALHEDIGDVAVACHENNILCKVIIETALLTDEEKIIACQVARMAGADFVKTSTGFNGGGATPADVALMRAVVGPGMGVKASGGVRDLAAAQAVIAAGANRIGTSAGVAIARQERGEAAAAESAAY